MKQDLAYGALNPVVLTRREIKKRCRSWGFIPDKITKLFPHGIPLTAASVQALWEANFDVVGFLSELLGGTQDTEETLLSPSIVRGAKQWLRKELPLYKKALRDNGFVPDLAYRKAALPLVIELLKLLKKELRKEVK